MKATKSVVVERARRVYGFGVGVSARRAFGFWRVEVTNGAGRIVASEDAASLPEAYGRLAAVLGGRELSMEGSR